jgi:hypothetical protein
MGCFISLLCGIRESERRLISRQENGNSLTNGAENNLIDEEILVYIPESACFRHCNQINGNKKLRAYKFIFTR